jgi:transcriptional regulator with XRE-family HTH domain
LALGVRSFIQVVQKSPSPPDSSMKKKETATIELQIGQKIRALRTERSVTLDQLATEVGLTKGQVSKIENGKVSSPVSTLTRIAVALAVEPGYFFQNNGSNRPRAALVPRAERQVIVGRGTKLGHSYESLAYGLPFKKDFEPYLMRIEEKAIDPERNVFRHPGHELIFMLKGRMDYRHGGQVYHLEPGDSLFFDGTLEHGPVRVYSPPVEFLSIISNSEG